MDKRARVTLPTEENFFEETKELMARWGADAIRDSDGTELEKNIMQLPAKVYKTYFVARGHNEFIKGHLEERQQVYLMSKRCVATGDYTLEIELMDGYYLEQLEPDYTHDPKRWWEVINRTTGEVVPPEQWQVKRSEGVVVIDHIQPFHEYTVSFLAYIKWDPTHMYNHITNDWGDVPHDIPFDVHQPNSRQFMQDYLRQWLADNPETDVVRFTTFFYHFTLIFNDLAKEKFVDWFGYGATVSVKALEAFEEAKGYALRPEDLVDNGYYNTAFRVPSAAYLDYIDYISEFVCEEARQLVEIVHEHDKEAMMFLGDNWIGTEPYGKYFERIGMDAVVGSVGDGATLRMISDIPHIKYSEGRFLPYFFPDTFYEGNNPVVEANERWIAARRAQLRSPLDRMGYGGYPSLAYKFPEFVDYIEEVTDEFRDIVDKIDGCQPEVKLTVGIMSAWGSLRTWQHFMVAHALWYKQIYSYLGILEALSGMAVDVKFVSFDEVISGECLAELDVLINAGDEMTAFSGGEQWAKPELQTAIRRFVHRGGGFVGVGDPSAYQQNGRHFQLADVLGVDKEVGFSLSTNAPENTPVDSHFITDGLGELDFGERKANIYPTSRETTILAGSEQGEVYLSTSNYGRGRSVYLAGLPYSIANTRLLLKVLLYAAGKEADYEVWHASNPNVEVNVYPEKGLYAVVNNTTVAQETEVFDGEGQVESITLAPSELRWEELS